MDSKDLLLKLIRIAIGNETDLSLPDHVDWTELIDLAFRQGVASVAYDGLQQIYDARPELEMELDDPEFEESKYEWFGSVLDNEMIYAQYEASIGELAAFYKENSFRMMLLKGYGLSRDYPVPQHRPCGDVDIYQFGRQEEADKALEARFGIAIDNSEHKHSVFNFKGVHVENHYDILNVYSHKSNAYLDAELKDMAEKKTEKCVVGGTEVYLPSPDFNALYLLRHTSAHLSGAEITLRHLLDWGLFVRNHHSEVDWGMVETESKKVGMLEFYRIQNLVCWKHLGFDPSLFPSWGCDEDLAERVLADIICPEAENARPKGVVRYIWRRYKYWRANVWKHKLAYANENIVIMFFVEALSHLRKPASLKN